MSFAWPRVKVTGLCRQHRTAPIYYLTFTLRAGTATATGRGQKDASIGEVFKQLATGGTVIDFSGSSFISMLYIAAGHQL